VWSPIDPVCPIDLQIAEPVARTKRSPMKIPPSESALLIRTDFSDESAWQKLLSEVRDPADPFIFNMEIVDNGANSSATVDQLMEAIPETYPHSFMVVADSMAISQPEHPLLVVDLFEERGSVPCGRRTGRLDRQQPFDLQYGLPGIC